MKATKFTSAVQQAGGVTRKKLRQLKSRHLKFPLSLERRYTTAISRYLEKQWKEYTAMVVEMILPRQDAVDDLFPGVGEYGPSYDTVLGIAEGFNKFNKKEWKAFLEIAIGAAFNEDEFWVAATLERWSREQVALITKASQDMKDAVARRVRNGVKNGRLNSEIEKLIYKEMPGISFRRARVIARDQSSKLTGELTHGRMEEAGLETYIWSTAADERVRGFKDPNTTPSHWVMEGKRCRWDDYSVYYENGEWVKRPDNAPLNHPGLEIMCRCIALPDWDELNEISKGRIQ